jgi:putative ABC transport system ATP-binding protein
MIQIHDVFKTYTAGETEVQALRGVSSDISRGEFTSIAGPSGSGKTTLLNCIGCIDSVDSGVITIDGQRVTGMDKKEAALFRRHKLGFVFQSYNLIPVLTAFENVSFALSLLKLSENEINERVYLLLKDVGLEGMEHRRPAKLSGGQQQRVAIARALIKEPDIVLADEPTANLDSKTGESILRLMKRLNEKKGTTFLFSTHDSMVMDFADRLIQLHDGLISSDSRRSG